MKILLYTCFAILASTGIGAILGFMYPSHPIIILLIGFLGVFIIGFGLIKEGR